VPGCCSGDGAARCPPVHVSSERLAALHGAPDSAQVDCPGAAPGHRVGHHGDGHHRDGHGRAPRRGVSRGPSRLSGRRPRLPLGPYGATRGSAGRCDLVVHGHRGGVRLLGCGDGCGGGVDPGRGEHDRCTHLVPSMLCADNAASTWRRQTARRLCPGAKIRITGKFQRHATRPSAGDNTVPDPDGNHRMMDSSG
jgi:hypothetical protein